MDDQHDIFPLVQWCVDSDMIKSKNEWLSEYFVYIMWFDKEFPCVHLFVYWGQIRKSTQLHFIHVEYGVIKYIALDSSDKQTEWSLFWRNWNHRIEFSLKVSTEWKGELQIIIALSFGYPCFKSVHSTTEIIQFYYIVCQSRFVFHWYNAFTKKNWHEKHLCSFNWILFQCYWYVNQASWINKRRTNQNLYLLMNGCVDQ